MPSDVAVIIVNWNGGAHLGACSRALAAQTQTRRRLLCYLEDVDLGFRMRLSGWDAMHVPAALCYHAGSALTGRRSDFSTYYGQRNMVWTFVKNMPSWLFWLLLPAHLLLNFLAPLAFVGRRQVGVVLRAKRDALRAWPALWRKRAAVQRAREVGAVAIWAVLDKRLWPGRAGSPSP